MTGSSKLFSLGQVACPSLLGRWQLGLAQPLMGWDGMGWKCGWITEPIPSPDDEELCDRLCFNMSVIGTNKPRCPGHGDKAGENWGVRGHWQMAFVGNTGLSLHSWGLQCQPGHESRPCPLQFPQQEALRNRTWILMCVYKMLLVASNDRQISSPLSTVPHILPCISAQGSSASSLVWVVLKQHFCGSFQKTTDVCPFPSAAESLPVLITPFSFSGSLWTPDALSTVCHPNSVPFSLEPIGGILALSASVSRPSSSPYFFIYFCLVDMFLPWFHPCFSLVPLVPSNLLFHHL